MKVKGEFIIYVLLLFLLIFLCPHDQFESDAKAWSDWSIYMWHHGYANVYNSDQNLVNYNPFYLIILRLYAGLMGTDEAIKSHVYMLKYLTLSIEWLGVIYMTYTLSDQRIRLRDFMSCFVNIGFLYNTLSWGQIDGMLSAFVVSSFILLYRRQLILSTLMLVLALNTKLVGIFYLPLWGLLLLQQIRGYHLAKIAAAVGAGAALQILIILPFIRAGNVQQLVDVNFHAVGYYHFVSLAAFNFWHVVFSGKLNEMADTGTWISITYRQWGMLLFFISAFVTLLPVLKETWVSYKRSELVTGMPTILLCGGLLCLSLFYFNTEMHERYSHVALWFFAAYAFVSKRFAPFILVSLAVFLNMAMACSEVFALQYKLIAGIFAMAMITAFIDLYTNKLQRGPQETSAN